ncbi:MAG: hypothetical protein Q8R92_21180 [Deltaproteobacteria bacterium]|nr:hypothetical protein [Deltaproteobacteria bacterium]
MPKTQTKLHEPLITALRDQAAATIVELDALIRATLAIALREEVDAWIVGTGVQPALDASASSAQPQPAPQRPKKPQAPAEPPAPAKRSQSKQKVARSVNPTAKWRNQKRLDAIADLVEAGRATPEIAAELGGGSDAVDKTLKKYGARARAAKQPVDVPPFPHVGQLRSLDAARAPTNEECPRCHSAFSCAQLWRHVLKCGGNGSHSTAPDGSAGPPSDPTPVEPEPPPTDSPARKPAVASPSQKPATTGRSDRFAAPKPYRAAGLPRQLQALVDTGWTNRRLAEETSIPLRRIGDIIAGRPATDEERAAIEQLAQEPAAA